MSVAGAKNTNSEDSLSNLEVSGVDIGVLGSGSWGTALAQHLARSGHRVRLWGRDKEVIRSINESNENTRYFPGEKLHPAVRGFESIEEAITDVEMLVFAVPSSATRKVAMAAAQYIKDDLICVSTAKGLEGEGLNTMSQVLGEVLGENSRLAILGGPSFAFEVVKGLPAAVTVAGSTSEVAKRVATIFHSRSFRIYTSTDMLGVEYGGVIKNVIALAAGIVDGAGMGSNARAALITRGVAEMKRLTEALGGDRRTVGGLSGLGDLLLTATGDLSRNRRVGLMLGEGKNLDEIVGSLGQVAEAVKTAPKLAELARKNKVNAPIIEQMDKVVSENKSIKQAIEDLLAREQKDELPTLT